MIDFEIRWLPGKEMTKADALSRQPALQSGDDEDAKLRPLLPPVKCTPFHLTRPDFTVRTNLFEEEPDMPLSSSELDALTDDTGVRNMLTRVHLGRVCTTRNQSTCPAVIASRPSRR